MTGQPVRVDMTKEELIELAKKQGRYYVTRAEFGSPDGLPIIGDLPQEHVVQLCRGTAAALGEKLLREYNPVIRFTEDKKRGVLHHEAFCFSADQLDAFVQEVYAELSSKTNLAKTPPDGRG